MLDNITPGCVNAHHSEYMFASDGQHWRRGSSSRSRSFPCSDLFVEDCCPVGETVQVGHLLDNTQYTSLIQYWKRCAAAVVIILVRYRQQLLEMQYPSNLEVFVFAEASS